MLELLHLGVTSNSAIVPSERNNLLVEQNSVHVPDGLVELPALDGASDFVSVFVVSTEIRNSAFSSYYHEENQGETRDR